MTTEGVGEIFACDCEWGYADARIGCPTACEPVIFCLKSLTSGARFSFWGRDGGLASFLDQHADAAFVSHYAIAEMSYLLRCGIGLPSRWVDTFVDFRKLTNGPDHQKAGLLDALDYFNLPHLETLEKDRMRDLILKLDYRDEDRPEIEDYCQGDCDGAGALHVAMGSRVPGADDPDVEFLKAISRMEVRGGVPMDVRTARLIIRSRISLRKELIDDINREVKLFDGETFKRKALFAWARKEGIKWPLKWSDGARRYYRSTDDETLKEMECRHPLIAKLRETKKSLVSLGLRSIEIDKVSRRHFFGTSVYRAVTGRRQPRKFVFSSAKWMRSLIQPQSKDHVLIYVDYVAQEIGIAAALSKDESLGEVYRSSDAHLAFALRAGAVPEGATKKSHPHMRKNYKTVNLGVLYGQTEWGISARLGITMQAARQIIRQHMKLFPRFWEWSDAIVLRAFDRGEIRTRLGWRSNVPRGSNRRTWMNWPIQATGSDLMRLTVIYLDRQGVELLCPVHDGFLISCRRDEVEVCERAIDWACGTAVDQILPGFPLRWDTKVFDGRYVEDDEDTQEFWDKIVGHLVKWFHDAAKHLR